MRDMPPQRLLALEGLRGLAAIMVVVFHAIIMFYPGMLYGVGSIYAPVQNLRFEDNIYGMPFNVFVSGPFAVAIFFVLSGFVLTVGFFKTRDSRIIKKLALKRYLRLMLPALASILIVYIILKLGLDHNMTLTQEITRSGWLLGLWNFIPHLPDALWQGVATIFTGEAVYYNPVLWTMRYELIGSFIVFFTALLIHDAKYRWVVYAILALVFFNTWYLGFILGLALADVYINKESILKSIKPIIFYPILLIGLFLGGYPGLSTQGTVYRYIDLPFLNRFQNESLYMTIGALLLIVCVLMIPWLSRILSTRFLSRLGKYTYSLYLTHMAVLFTITTGLFVSLSINYSLHVAAVVSILLSIPFLIIAAYLFEKYVDTPSIRFSSYVAKMIIGENKSPSRRLVARIRKRLKRSKV